jgi:hypothetical protein
MATGEVGRPLIYDDPNHLKDCIEFYFHDCKDKQEYPTVSGLALHLGFTSRQSFYDYEKYELFSDIIKKARLRIESVYEQKLHYKNPAGAIFALKNFGWVDKQEIKHEGIPDPTISVVIAKPTDD